MASGGHLRPVGDPVGRTPGDWAADVWAAGATDPDSKGKPS